eukprot:tig00000523_g1831.t1
MAVYPSPGDADLLVGLLAEKEQTGGLVGPLAVAIITDTIKTVRDTDPYWWDTLAAPVLNEIRARRFTDMVESAWAPFIKTMPRSVFIATPPPWKEDESMQDLSGSGNGNATSSGPIATANATTSTSTPSANSNATSSAPVAYTASARLNDVLSLRWSMLVATREIEVAVTCACDGWVALGLGNSMADADVVWMRHNASGSPLAIDAKAFGFRGPATDAKQDVVLVDASRSPGTQTFRWRRAWNTGDSAQDKPFSPGRQPLIFAWRASGTEFSMHRPTDVLRGSLDFFAMAGVSASVYAAAGSAAGSSSAGTGSNSPASDTGSSSSSSSSAGSGESVDFSVSEGRVYDNAYTVHAIAMGASWAVIAPVSIFIVRHLKHIPMWLKIHRGMMQLALSITVPAASAAFASRASAAEAKSHGLLGLALAVDSALQLGLGMLVKHMHLSRKPKRWAFVTRTAHRVNGWIVCLGALANVGLGQHLMMPSVRSAFLLWVAVLAVAFALGEVVSFYNKRRVEVVFDSINAKKVAPLTPSEFERMIRLGSQWVLVGDRVFDVEPILSTHPGGTALLHSMIGQDISAFLYGSGDRDDEAAVAGVQTWTVIERTAVCPSSRPVFRVRFACDVPPTYHQDDLRYLGQHFEVTATINGRDVHRHYSLVRIAHAGGARPAPTRARRPSVDPDGDLDYSATHDLWLRRYPTGAMSPYLLDAPLGSQIRVRGPLGLGLRLGHDTEGDLIAAVERATLTRAGPQVVAGTGILPLLDLVAHIRKMEDEHALELATEAQQLSPATAAASPVVRLVPREGPEPASLLLLPAAVHSVDVVSDYNEQPSPRRAQGGPHAPDPEFEPLAPPPFAASPPAADSNPRPTSSGSSPSNSNPDPKSPKHSKSSRTSFKYLLEPSGPGSTAAVVPVEFDGDSGSAWGRGGAAPGASRSLYNLPVAPSSNSSGLGTASFLDINVKHLSRSRSASASARDGGADGSGDGDGGGGGDGDQRRPQAGAGPGGNPSAFNPRSAVFAPRPPSGSAGAGSGAGAASIRRRRAARSGSKSARSFGLDRSKGSSAPPNTRLRLKLVACFESAEDIPELDWLEECASVCPALELFLFVGQPPSAEWLAQAAHRRSGRVDAAFLRTSVVHRTKALRFFYICGPPVFAHTIRGIATEIGVEPSAIVSL